ncbi:Uncharacterised protein [Mycobacteroides abscessus subsp. abscessus]|nr:Uncharacterised protein [Mycobacteroides abscessus subsp. abscessus]
MAKRPLDRWSAVAPNFASTAGCHSPGCTAAMTFNRSVAPSRARLNEVDSCWYSAP